MLASPYSPHSLDRYGLTRLHWAAIIGDSRSLRSHLRMGGSPDVRDDNGWTLFTYAVDRGHFEIADSLLSSGADIDAHSKDGYSILHHTYNRQRDKTCQYLLSRGARWQLPTGNERDEMLLLSAVWGVGGVANIMGADVERCGGPLRARPLAAQADAIETYIQDNPLHNIPNPHEIIDAFRDAADLPFEQGMSDKQVARIKRGDLVVVRTGWYKHEITLIFYKGYFAICNRGEGAPTCVYKINPARVTAKLFSDLRKPQRERWDYTKATGFFKGRLIRVLEGRKDDVCRAMQVRPQQSHELGFCAYYSPEDALYHIISLQHIFKRQSSRSRTLDPAKRSYTDCTSYFHLYFLERYLNLPGFKDNDLLREISERLNDPECPCQRFAEYRNRVTIKLNFYLQSL